MTNQARLEYLFQRYLDRVETPVELEELMELVNTDDHKEAIEQLLDAARPSTAQTDQLNDEQTERLFQAISQQTSPAPVIPMTGSRKWRWVAAAAAIMLAIGLGSYLFFSKSTSKQGTEVAAITPSDVEAPKATKATITLADGRTVALDSLMTLAQNNVQLTKTADGQLIYSGSASALAYNTLTNPRGSQVIDITLADGSKVWLNAGSSVTYPVAFTGNERKVAITGEAYFEVSHDKTKPFYVTKGNVQIQVLGTHFNVNAYDEVAKVTLLEGSVRVSAIGNRQSAILKPGEQAELSGTHSPFTIHHSPDLEQIMAWKNGLFEFNETDIQTIMAQIERWYDVQVIYEGAVTQHFNGTIQRQVNVSKVLGMLEKAGGLQFSIEGKKVLVRKK
jgi:ferric-dicitrate binding protein FerR (iron transport regulator)